MSLQTACLLTCAVTISLGYDIELEGVVRMGKDFLRRLNGDIAPSLDKRSTNEPLLIEKLFGRSNDLEIEDAPVKRVDEKNEQKESFMPNFIKYIIDTGVDKLNSLGKIITRDLKLKNEIVFKIRAATFRYSLAIRSYSNKVMNQKTHNEIDKEYLILDIIETSYQVLFSESRRLLNDIVDEIGAMNESNDDIQKVTGNIYKAITENKKEQFKYICDKADICRPYPAFSDYLSDLISELLKLRDEAFTDVVIILEEITTNKVDFFKTIIKYDVLKKICTELKILVSTPSNLNEFFAIVRAVITQRHKLLQSEDTDLMSRTKAVRILLDIIDKAFDVGGEDIIVIEFDNTITAFRNWAYGFREDIATVLKQFIGNVVQTLRYYLSPETKQEMMILSEVIVKGHSDNKNVYNLLAKGSKFLRGEHTHIEVI